MIQKKTSELNSFNSNTAQIADIFLVSPNHIFTVLLAIDILTE